MKCFFFFLKLVGNGIRLSCAALPLLSKGYNSYRKIKGIKKVIQNTRPKVWVGRFG